MQFSLAQDQGQHVSALLETARIRLQDVYEEHVFRPVSVRGEWLPDSSGFAREEIDPVSGQRKMVLYDLKTNPITISPMQEESPLGSGRLTSPDGRKIIVFRNGSLWVRDVESGNEHGLLSNPNDRDVDYRNPTWSPDSRQILFTEVDSSDVNVRNALVPDDPSYPSIRESRFARVGGKIASLRLGIAMADGTGLNWLAIEMPDEGCYFGHVGWAANSTEVIVERLSRFRDRRDFLIVALNGQTQTIFSETNDAWAVGSHGINSLVDWVQEGNAFLFISEQDGWRHAYLCSRDGKDLMLLTPGDYELIDRSVIDENGGWFYFYASPENATQKYLYRVPLDGTGTLERVTPDGCPGTHDYEFSPDRKWALHTYSTIDTPPIVELVEMAEHRVVQILEDNAPLRARMQALDPRPTEFLQLDIGDGITMDAWMLKPRDFDESKKYPVFVYVYGEPYAQTVLDRWGAVHIDFHRVIADLGYLVVSIDNRGTPAPKGAAWRRSIFGSLGPLSTQEQAAGLKALAKSRSYVDLSRVGIWGWSGGGSNTLNAMFREPDIYDVGIAVVPKPQPHLYNAWFQEIYMRTREVNPAGYERSAPINFAEGLQGKLLIITGSGETNTHIQIIEGLVDRLIELGKSFDYMVYPNRDHGLREGRGSELHVRMLITRYLLENLPSGPH